MEIKISKLFCLEQDLTNLNQVKRHILPSSEPIQKTSVYRTYKLKHD